MKTIVLSCFLSLLALLPCGNARAQEVIRIIVYGDSLTSGYNLQPEQAFPARLEQKLKRAGYTNVSVINMSADGATTHDGLERIGQVLVQQPDIVLVELGTEDARRGIDIAVTYNNLALIASNLIRRQIYIIMAGGKAPASMGYSYDKRFEEIFPRIAGAYKLPLYPFILDGVAGNPDLNLADGLHPNNKGVKIMVDRIYPLVDTAVRWKWDAQQKQQQWQQDNQGIVMPPPPPLSVTP